MTRPIGGGIVLVSEGCEQWRVEYRGETMGHVYPSGEAYGNYAGDCILTARGELYARTLGHARIEDAADAVVKLATYTGEGVNA